MIFIIIAVVMLVIGVFMQLGKGGFLISGYNTMSKEQQAQVDFTGLSKLMMYFSYVLALIFLLMALFEWLNEPNAILVCIALLLVVTIAVIFKSRKFYANVTNKGKFSKGGQWAGIISIVIVMAVGILLYFSAKPTALTATADDFTIGGLYGDTFTWQEMQQLELIDTMPEVSMRTNGSAIGSKLQGHFTLENGESVKLFIDKGKPPFITFVVEGKRYYVNEVASDQTVALFEQMLRNK